MEGSRTETLSKILGDLQNACPDIQASVVVSTDGFIIASASNADVEEEKVAALGAGMLSLAEKATQELQRGEIDQAFLRGKDGYLIVMNTGNGAVLTVLTAREAKPGLIFLDIKRCAEEVGKIL